MRGVARKRHAAGPIASGNPGVTAKPGRVLDPGELGPRRVTPEHLAGLGDEIACVGRRPQVDTPPPVRQRGQDHRRLVQVRGDWGVVGVPPFNSRVEDGPLRFDVGAGNSIPTASRTTLCSRSHPTTHRAKTSRRRPRRSSVASQRPRSASSHQVGRAGDGTAVCLEAVRKRRLGDFLESPELNAVAAAGESRLSSARILPSE